MPLAPIPWACSIGDSPPVTLNVASTVSLAIQSSNRVIISGTGTIASFGLSGVNPITGAKLSMTFRVTFQPTGGNIVLTTSANLQVLGPSNRTITHTSAGVWVCNQSDVWSEHSYVDTTTGLLNVEETEARMNQLEQRIKRLEERGGS